MLPRHDLNRVNVLKNNLLNANKMLYNASEKEVIEFFNSQDDLIKDIKDLPIRNKLLAESKYLRVKTLSNHQTHTSAIDKVKKLTLNDGIFDCSSEQEANDYFNHLDKEIKAIPTESSNIVKLLELTKEYRESTLLKLKNR